jgi:hypothetical protein
MLLADRGYDADWIRELVLRDGSEQSTCVRPNCCSYSATALTPIKRWLTSAESHIEVADLRRNFHVGGPLKRTVGALTPSRRPSWPRLSRNNGAGGPAPPAFPAMVGPAYTGRAIAPRYLLLLGDLRDWGRCAS